MPRSYGGFIVAVAVALLVLYILSFSIITGITSVSAIETNVGVYWHSNCADADDVSFIDWGILTPGSTTNREVYIRNEESQRIFLLLSTTDWDPSNASLHLDLGWNHFLGCWMEPGEVLPTTLTLSVSRYIEGISNFRFCILITGSQSLPGDCNGDGFVNAIDVNSYMSFAYGSQDDDPSYNPNCDFNDDGFVNAIDVNNYISLYYGYGETA